MALKRFLVGFISAAEANESLAGLVESGFLFAVWGLSEGEVSGRVGG